MRSPRLRESKRHRGNQGDWAKTTRGCGELPEHKEHNETVRLKNLEKKSIKSRRSDGR